VNDRFLRACRREPVDATPVWFMRQAGRALPEYRAVRKTKSLVEITRDAALCAEVSLQPVRRLAVDAAIVFADITTPLPGMGIDVEIRPGIGPVIDPPIRSAADVARLQSFEPREHVSELLEAIGILRRESPVPVVGFAGAPFTLASYLVEGGPTRRFDVVKRFLHHEPAAWSDLMERLTEAGAAYLAAQIEAGAQAIQLFDSWAGVLSPADYRRHVAPWVRRLFASLPAAPTIHFATQSAGILPWMAEAGGDVVGLDWRIDLARGWALVGDRGVQGNLDPVLAACSWPVAERAAREVLEQAAGRRGHVFNLGHGVLPHTPVDNLRRMVDIVHEATARQTAVEA
jgi:uroporphyrinogen decarboxylase